MKCFSEYFTKKHYIICLKNNKKWCGAYGARTRDPMRDRHVF